MRRQRCCDYRGPAERSRVLRSAPALGAALAGADGWRGLWDKEVQHGTTAEPRRDDRPGMRPARGVAGLPRTTSRERARAAGPARSGRATIACAPPETG